MTLRFPERNRTGRASNQHSVQCSGRHFSHVCIYYPELHSISVSRRTKNEGSRGGWVNRYLYQDTRRGCSPLYERKLNQATEPDPQVSRNLRWLDVWVLLVN